jgi:hypothetical protein
MFDTNPARTIIRNPLNGFCNRKKRIRNIGATKAAIGKIHLPLKKKREINPINK